jgi:hypothetical protein
LTYQQAAFAALKDLQNLLAFAPDPSAHKRYETLLSDPSHVKTPEDHRDRFYLDEAYCLVEFYEGSNPQAADVRRQRELIRDGMSRCAVELIMYLAQIVQRQGGRLLFKNVSHPEISQIGIHCAKAIALGLFPIWYGPARFRVTRRFTAIAGAGSSAVTNVNLDPHPFG